MARTSSVRRAYVTLTVAFALSVAWTLVGPARVALAVRSVSSDGTRDYTTIQAAINASSTDPNHPDTIIVYESFPLANAYEENVVLDRPVNIIGVSGAASVVVEANGNGRALTLLGQGTNIGPSILISGITFRNGDATGGTPSDPRASASTGCGGGVLISGASPTFVNNIVQNNTASNRSDLSGNGGGICLLNSNAIVDSNVIVGNAASPGFSGNGGGIYVSGGLPTIRNNTISGNYATLSNSDSGRGGGVFLSNMSNVMERNTITGNTASRCLPGNRPNDTTCAQSSSGQGGGIYIDGGSPTLKYNLISSNNANNVRGGGGGIWMENSSAKLTGNTVVDNYDGGPDDFRSNGVKINGGSGWMLDSNIVARNRYLPDASRPGAGIAVENSQGELRHTTIANNDLPDGGEVQAGLEVRGTSTVILINTIISGHDAGVWSRSSGSSANLSYTLFFGNGVKIKTESGNPVNNQNEVSSGDPQFVAPNTYPPDYHIKADSAARDKGAATGVTTDVDELSRTIIAPDIGADEFPYGFSLASNTLGQAVAGKGLTYNFTYRLVGYVDAPDVTLTANLPDGVTDIVPSHSGVVSGNTVTWRWNTLTPGPDTSATVQVTVPDTLGGTLVSTARIASGEGVAAESSISLVVESGYRVRLPLVIR